MGGTLHRLSVESRPIRDSSDLGSLPVWRFVVVRSQEAERMQSHRSRRPRSGGFTLVESLVVVGISCVRIAILLPALSGAREQARRATGASNLRQMGGALAVYVGDWKYFPGCQVSRAGGT